MMQFGFRSSKDTVKALKVVERVEEFNRKVWHVLVGTLD